MSPRNYTDPASVRSAYAFMFTCMSRLYEYHYCEKISSKSDDARKAIERLFSDGLVSEYVIENSRKLFDEYKTLIPEVQKQLWLKDRDAEGKRLDSINMLVNDITADLCEDIKEAIDAQKDADIKGLLNESQF